MATPTLTQLQNAERDLQTLGAVSNDLGTTTTREGATVKTVRQVILDAQTAVDGASFEAQAWASREATDGTVDYQFYSALAYAQGDLTTAGADGGGSAKDWAQADEYTDIDGLGGKSAYAWAQEAKAWYELFGSQYLGAQASDPTVDQNGNAVTVGDWYFNTVSNKARIYDGSNWADVVSGLTAGANATITGEWSFLDGGFTLKNSTDDTKQLQFDLSQNTAGTTRTLTAPDHDGVIQINRSGPLGISPSITDFSKTQHNWSGTYWIDTENENRHWRACAFTFGHESVEGAYLRLFYSDDGMNSWQAGPVISDDASTEPRFQIGGMMYNGRQGVMYALLDNAGDIVGYDFVYSDNQWSSWTRISFPAHPGSGSFGGNIQFYGKIIPWPAAAGGSDTGGFKIFGYGGDPANIVYIETTDNGGNWVFGTAIDSTAVLSQWPSGFTEPSVAVITAGSRYALAARDRAATGSDSQDFPVIVSTSTDLTNWSTPVAIGELPLGSNPVVMVCDGGYTGRIHVYAVARQDAIDGYNNALMHSSVSASAFFDADGDVAFPSYNLKGHFRNEFTGYIGYDQDSAGNYYGLAQGAESLLGTTKSSMGEVYAFTPYPVASFSSYAGQKLSIGENLFRNPTFNFWTDGTSFGPGTSLDTADGWKYEGESSATITRQDIDADVRKHIPGSPYYAYRVAVGASAGTNVQQIARQEWAGREQIARLANKNITVQMYFGGSTPDAYTVEAGINFGTGGSPTTAKTEAVQMSKFNQLGDGVRYAEATVAFPRLEGNTEGDAPVWGSNNDEYAYVTIRCSSFSFTVDLYSLKMEFGDVATLILPPNPDDEVFALHPLTAAKLQQLQNIGESTTISATQWDYLGAMNQGVATTDSPTFANLYMPSGSTIGSNSGSNAHFLRAGASSNVHAFDSNDFYIRRNLRVAASGYDPTGAYYHGSVQVVGARVIDANLADTAALTAQTLTDNSGGTASDTIAAIGASYSQTEVANAIASLIDEVNKLRADNVAQKAAIDATLSLIRTHGLGATA